MKKDTRNLLKECSSGCKMAIESMEQMEKYIQNDKLRDINHDYKRKHEKIERDIAMLLAEAGEEDQEPKVTAAAFSKITTEVKLMMENDSHEIAKILMDGCNMGIQSVCEYQNKYIEAEPEAKEIAKTIVRIEEDLVQELKQFL